MNAPVHFTFDPNGEFHSAAAKHRRNRLGREAWDRGDNAAVNEWSRKIAELAIAIKNRDV